jgi:hypothetical protein
MKQSSFMNWSMKQAVNHRVNPSLNRRFGRARRRGSVIHVVAGSLILLLGCASLAVDYGILVSDKNQLQRVCDAAALAGALKLPDTSKATTQAEIVAEHNRFKADSSNTISYTFPTAKRIRVEATRKRSLFFARIFGQQEAMVRASAIATGFGGTPNIAPIGITDTTFNLENPIVSGRQRRYDSTPSPVFTIKLIDHKKETLTPGEFILFDLRDPQSKSAEFMKRQLTGEENINITVDEVGAVEETDATALNARAQGEFLYEGMTTRFQLAAGTPWLDIDPAQGTSYADYEGQHFDQVFNGTEPLGDGSPFTENPRVLSLIVTRETTAPTSGILNAPVLDLAPVYVTRMYQGASPKEVFLEYRYLPLGLIAGGKAALVE